MKKLLFSLFAIFLTLPAFGADDFDIKNNIIPETNQSVINYTGAEEGFDILDTILLYIKDSIFNLLALFAIGVFLYTGALLITARGNQEQFKKAMKSFVYAVVGLVIVALAWAAVKIIAGVTI